MGEREVNTTPIVIMVMDKKKYDGILFKHVHLLAVCFGSWCIFVVVVSFYCFFVVFVVVCVSQSCQCSLAAPAECGVRCCCKFMWIPLSQIFIPFRIILFPWRITYFSCVKFTHYLYSLVHLLLIFVINDFIIIKLCERNDLCQCICEQIYSCYQGMVLDSSSYKVSP